MKRALIVANKWWEADPLVDVLSSGRTAPAGSHFTVPTDGTPGLRGMLDGVRGRVEVWCLQELMPARVSASSSEAKAVILPRLLNREEVAIVVAFGTAAWPNEGNINGGVVIGTNVFLHDPMAKDTTSHWDPPEADVLIPSALSEHDFNALVGSPTFGSQVKASMLPPPMLPGVILTDPPPTHPFNPGLYLQVMIDYNFVALCEINVTNYLDYDWSDQNVVDAYVRSGSVQPMGSLETTHGVIRSCGAAPFLFVSGITDRLNKFHEDVAPATYAQNFIAAHNAGIAVANLIPQLQSLLAAP
jgi:hypothetical protein